MKECLLCLAPWQSYSQTIDRVGFNKLGEWQKSKLIVLNNMSHNHQKALSVNPFGCLNKHSNIFETESCHNFLKHTEVHFGLNV
jgi:hypothetical protein